MHPMDKAGGTNGGYGHNTTLKTAFRQCFGLESLKQELVYKASRAISEFYLGPTGNR